MPWLSIIIAIITALASLKKNPEKKGAAVAAGALAGLGTYYVSHNTEWGQDVLGPFDGVEPPSLPEPLGDDAVTLPDGSKTTTTVAVPSATNGVVNGVTDVLKSWGPMGTAAVIGATGAVATGNSKWLLYGGIAIAAILLLK